MSRGLRSSSLRGVEPGVFFDSCLLKSRLSTLRGLTSAGTACVGELKLQCE